MQGRMDQFAAAGIVLAAILIGWLAAAPIY
jgi:hypothetical protein